MIMGDDVFFLFMGLLRVGLMFKVFLRNLN